MEKRRKRTTRSKEPTQAQAFLETKQDSDIREIQDDIIFLKTSLYDRINSKLKMEASQNKSFVLILVVFVHFSIQIIPIK